MVVVWERFCLNEEEIKRLEQLEKFRKLVQNISVSDTLYPIAQYYLGYSHFFDQNYSQSAQRFGDFLTFPDQNARRRAYAEFCQMLSYLALGDEKKWKKAITVIELTQPRHFFIEEVVSLKKMK